MVSGAKINRREFELYLRNMTSEIIEDNETVKTIVDEVFEQININSLHKKYKNKDEAKMELVSFTRKRILEYLDTCSDVDKYTSVKDYLNSYAKKYFKYNMYFNKNKSIEYNISESMENAIYKEVESLSNIEKEVLIRRFYFFQSSEKIAKALNISTYKVYSIIRQLVKSLWSKVLLNDELVENDKLNIDEIVKNIEEYYKAISGRNKSFAKYKVVDKEVEEYFVIRLLDNLKISEIEFTFDDICLENMSRVVPHDEDYEKLEYLSVFRNYPQSSTSSKVIKRKKLYRKLVAISLCGAMCLSMILFFGKNSILAKASNKNISYKVSSSKMGLSFTYNKNKDDIDIDIEQDYYVDDSSMPDYTDRIDTELAVRVDKNNIYADLKNVEQTVYESASMYLNLGDEGGFKYKKGDRKYVYNELYNILFIAEYKDGAWECTKVIYVDKINEASKYHLDDYNTLQGFYLDSNDGKWKCELHNDKIKDTFSEITFEYDDSKMLGLGTYKTANMYFKRDFDKNSGKITLNQTYESSEKLYEEEFLTYIVEDGYTSIYYNCYKDGELCINNICVVNNQVLENIGEYIKQSPEKILNDVQTYGILLPETETYILPYLENNSSHSDYRSDYYEFSHYDTKDMEKATNLSLKIYISGETNKLNTYRLYNNDYYIGIKKVEDYKEVMGIKNHIFYDSDIGDYRIRIFDNSYVEILEYRGNDIKVTIPNYLNGFKVMYIGNNVFKDNANIKEVVLPKTIKEIGSSTFKGCESLEEITFKGEIIGIGKSAFSGCKNLEVVNLKNTPKYIGKNCFKETKYIKTLENKDGVIYLRKAVIKVVKEKKSLVLKDDIITIADGFINGKGEKLYSITIPNNVKYIGKAAFKDLKMLIGITLNSKVKYIGAEAFKGCISLENINIESPLEVVNEGTFSECISLEKVYLPSTVKAIRKNAFKGVNKDCKMNISNNTKCIF